MSNVRMKCSPLVTLTMTLKKPAIPPIATSESKSIVLYEGRSKHHIILDQIVVSGAATLATPVLKPRSGGHRLLKSRLMSMTDLHFWPGFLGLFGPRLLRLNDVARWVFPKMQCQQQRHDDGWQAHNEQDDMHGSHIPGPGL